MRPPLRRRTPRRPIPRAAIPIQRIAAVIITSVWAVVMLVTVFGPAGAMNDNVVTGANGLMTVTIAYLFASDAGRNKDGPRR